VRLTDNIGETRDFASVEGNILQQREVQYVCAQIFKPQEGGSTAYEARDDSFHSVHGDSRHSIGAGAE
jgi:hypothetical protein